MALLHAIQLYNGIVTSATPVTVYTVPAGNRIILREVDFQNQSASITVVQLRVDAAATIWAPSLAAYPNAGSSNQWKGWMVLGPGQAIAVNPGTAARPIAVVVSGSIYTI